MSKLTIKQLLFQGKLTFLEPQTGVARAAFSDIFFYGRVVEKNDKLCLLLNLPIESFYYSKNFKLEDNPLLVQIRTDIKCGDSYTYFEFIDLYITEQQIKTIKTNKTDLELNGYIKFSPQDKIKVKLKCIHDKFNSLIESLEIEMDESIVEVWMTLRKNYIEQINTM